MIPALATQPSVTFTVVENGVYELPFDVFDDSNNLHAWYRDSEDSPQDLKFGTDLVINFDSGFGTIFLVKDLAVGSKFTVVRTIQNDQTKTFKSTQLFSTQIENALDKLTTIAQDNDFEKTCMRTASDEDAKLELPIGESRINTALMFRDDGRISVKSLNQIGAKVPATRTDLGLVIVGDNLTVEDSGLLNVAEADNATVGLFKVGTGIDLNNGTISVDLAGVKAIAEEADEKSAETNRITADVATNILTVNTIATTANSKVQERVIDVFVPSGMVWHAGTSLPTGHYYGITTIGSRLVTVGASSALAYSDNGGDTWTSATTPPTGSYHFGITVLGTRLVTVGNYFSVGAYSDDRGDNWTAAGTPPVGNFYCITTIESRVVATGSSGACSYSDDGNVWVDSTTPPPSAYYYGIMAIGPRLVTVGDSVVAYSDDKGDTWTAATTVPAGTYRAVIALGGRLIMVGTSSVAAYSDDGGDHWTAADTPPTSGSYYGLIKVGSRVIAVGSWGAFAYTDDGNIWVTLDNTPTGEYRAVTSVGTKLVSVGISSRAAYSDEFYEHLTVPEAINRILEQKGV